MRMSETLEEVSETTSALRLRERLSGKSKLACDTSRLTVNKEYGEWGDT